MTLVLADMATETSVPRDVFLLLNETTEFLKAASILS